jgi:Sulfotransferase family
MAAVVRDLVQAQNTVAARRNRVRVLRAASGRSTPVPEFEKLRAATTDLLSCLMEVTGARLIVDASKRPEEAAIVAAAGSFDHYVLHIVRDPRAVVHSWGRSKPVRTAAGPAKMANRSALKTISQWIESAAGAELLRRSILEDRWLFLRYEDFVTSPRTSVRSVLSFLGEDAMGPFLSDTTVHLDPGHVLSGNPDRFETGTVEIQPDMEWLHLMPRRKQALIQMGTAPFLVRYGYVGTGATTVTP